MILTTWIKLLVLISIVVFILLYFRPIKFLAIVVVLHVLLLEWLVFLLYPGVGHLLPKTCRDICNTTHILASKTMLRMELAITTTCRVGSVAIIRPREVILSGTSSAPIIRLSLRARLLSRVTGVSVWRIPKCKLSRSRSFTLIWIHHRRRGRTQWCRSHR